MIIIGYWSKTWILHRVPYEGINLLCRTTKIINTKHWFCLFYNKLKKKIQSNQQKLFRWLDILDSLIVLSTIRHFETNVMIYCVSVETECPHVKASWDVIYASVWCLRGFYFFGTLLAAVYWMETHGMGSNIILLMCRRSFRGAGFVKFNRISWTSLQVITKDSCFCLLNLP